MISQLKDQFTLYWMARTEQERKFLSIGGAVAVSALVYALLIAPALEGRAALSKALPEMRQKASNMTALAAEAGELARRPTPQVTPMSKETLTASLATRSITPQSVVMSGEMAKLQLNGISYANLYSWLDAQRRENRIQVEDIAATAATPAGNVDVVLTLRQSTGEAGR